MIDLVHLYFSYLGSLYSRYCLLPFQAYLMKCSSLCLLAELALLIQRFCQSISPGSLNSQQRLIHPILSGCLLLSNRLIHLEVLLLKEELHYRRSQSQMSTPCTGSFVLIICSYCCWGCCPWSTTDYLEVQRQMWPWRISFYVLRSSIALFLWIAVACTYKWTLTLEVISGWEPCASWPTLKLGKCQSLLQSYQRHVVRE